MDEQSVRCGDAAREGASAREAHRHNTTLLSALRVTQAEHSKVLGQHTEILNQHTETLNQHTEILNQHTAILGKLTVGVHDIQLSIKQLIERDGNGSGSDD